MTINRRADYLPLIRDATIYMYKMKSSSRVCCRETYVIGRRRDGILAVSAVHSDI